MICTRAIFFTAESVPVGIYPDHPWSTNVWLLILICWKITCLTDVCLKWENPAGNKDDSCIDYFPNKTHLVRKGGWILHDLVRDIFNTIYCIWVEHMMTNYCWLVIYLPKNMSSSVGVTIPNIWNNHTDICIYILVGAAITILKNDGLRQWDGKHPIYYGKS